MAAVLPSTVFARPRSVDTPRIMEWHQIGGIGLGMTHRQVNATYRATAFQDGVDYSRYDVDRGSLWVWYARGVVVHFFTTSPRYRTPAGVGVGARIPLGPCHRTHRARCEHRWHGLVYYPGQAEWRGRFCYRGVRSVAWLPTRLGRVEEVDLSYDAGVCGRQQPRFPLTAADRAAITAAILPRADGVHEWKVSHFRVTIDTKRWASAWVTAKPEGSAQGGFFVLEHRRDKWVVLDYGTSWVGCSVIPIKPLTQIGGSCR